ncbi:MAG: hypothetical protein HKN10_19220, partial [Myxococcales bacterium]|nr:hypothetical protein [Myxococcales bacterium]
MKETYQKLLAVFGVLALVTMFGVAAKVNSSVTPEEYCAKQGGDGWKAIEARCLRRLSAGVCYDSEECKLFPSHRYLPNLDSSIDIRCDGDTGGDHYTDFAVTGCQYVGPNAVTEGTESGLETRQVAQYEWKTYDQERGKSRSLAAFRNVLNNWTNVEILDALTMDMKNTDNGGWWSPDVESKQGVHTDERTVLRVAHRLRRQEQLIVGLSAGGHN